MSDDLHYLPLMEVADRLRRREVTSLEVTRALIERIGQHNGRLNGVLLSLADSALAEARRADAEIAAGFWRGPLHGVPIGVKDLLWTEGQPTTGGMAILKDFRPSEDATVVKRLRRAGAVIIAKLHTTEGATLDHHPSFPRPANPWSAAHWTGASSSGSGVSAAAGFCFGAIGTDTAGSIRIPSSANGLTGIKPTWGRVSRHGLIPLAASLDHVGPMARSAADAAAILQVIAGADADDPTALADAVPDYLAGIGRGVGDLAIGVDWDHATIGMPAEVVAAVRRAADVLAGLGARVRPIEFPSSDDGAADIGAMMQAETFIGHREHFPAEAEGYGARLRAQLERGPGEASAVARGYQARDRFAGRMRSVFRDVDLILSPMLGGILPTWREIEAFGDEIATRGRDLLRFTFPYNVAGVPALTFPGGVTADGLPIGLQLAAWRLGEADLLRAGHAFQGVTDFHMRHPAL